MRSLGKRSIRIRNNINMIVMNEMFKKVNFLNTIKS